MRRISLVLCAALFLFSLLPAATLAQSNAACTRAVTVVSGDTLTGLADTYLDDPLAFPRIIAATNAAAAADDSYATIDDEGRIVIGWKLCIPGAAAQAGPAASASVSEGGGPATSSGAAATINGAGSAAASSVPSDVFTFDGERLTVDFLRKQTYPGSDIVIEETLDPGVNYDRYIVSYRSEGLKQYALLTVPQGEQPATGWPAIIFNHGYIPPEVYRTTERYVAYVDGFARNGYVVFRPDYRGHGFSEGEARGAYGNPDYTIDVLNGLASVKRLDYVDPERIGMWGHSMGGYITLRAMVTSPDIKAGVIWAGVVASYPDLVERWNRQRPAVRRHTCRSALACSAACAVRHARGESRVLGLHLGQQLSQGPVGPGADSSRHGRRRGADRVLGQAVRPDQGRRRDRRNLHVSGRRPQHLAVAHHGYSALGCLLRRACEERR